MAIRDYYDLWSLAEAKFDFKNKHFLSIFMKKLEEEKYKGDYSQNFGLEKKLVELLRKQIDTELTPVIRMGESFDLDKVFERFNAILQKL